MILFLKICCYEDKILGVFLLWAPYFQISDHSLQIAIHNIVSSSSKCLPLLSLDYVALSMHNNTHLQYNKPFFRMSNFSPIVWIQMHLLFWFFSVHSTTRSVSWLDQFKYQVHLVLFSSSSQLISFVCALSRSFSHCSLPCLLSTSASSVSTTRSPF